MRSAAGNPKGLLPIAIALAGLFLLLFFEREHTGALLANHLAGKELASEVAYRLGFEAGTAAILAGAFLPTLLRALADRIMPRLPDTWACLPAGILIGLIAFAMFGNGYVVLAYAIAYLWGLEIVTAPGRDRAWKAERLDE